MPSVEACSWRLPSRQPGTQLHAPPGTAQSSKLGRLPHLVEGLTPTQLNRQGGTHRAFARAQRVEDDGHICLERVGVRQRGRESQLSGSAVQLGSS